MPNHFLFYLGLSFILMHEMDAVRCREWRIFPGLSLLNDGWGFKIFMFAHVPLFYFVSGQLLSRDNAGFIFWTDVFFIIHLGLHLLFLMHRKNEFKDWVSWTIIVGAALSGLLDLFS